MADFAFFSVLGIEIEYMLVDRDSLCVQPKSDVIFKSLAGYYASEVPLGDVALSNELVLHVLEVKNNGPRAPTEALVRHFHKALLELQPLLQEHNLCLLPTGAHPWMNPLLETFRWHHHHNEIYSRFDKIFNCKGHGWSNLQSMHVNLPYTNDEEFNKLHNAIRLILPLLPSLAASTPIIDSSLTGLLDTRLSYYMTNQERIPLICGDLIPEFISTEAEYQKKILAPMYAAVRPFDPEGILCNPWLNSRGCIPKFQPKALEIRILDTQECVTADIAIAKIIFSVLKNWCNASDYYLQRPCDTKMLKDLLIHSLKQGLKTSILHRELRTQWQIPNRLNISNLQSVWAYLIENNNALLDYKEERALEHILSKGNLSERILAKTGKTPHLNTLKTVYKQLASCLLDDESL